MNPAEEPILPSGVCTLPQLFAWRVGVTPDAEAYRQFDAGRGVWASTTCAEAGEHVAHRIAVIARLDMPPRSRIALPLQDGLAAG